MNKEELTVSIRDLIEKEISYFKKINIKIEDVKKKTINLNDVSNSSFTDLPSKGIPVIYVIKANTDLNLDYEKAKEERDILIGEKYAVSRISEKNNWQKNKKCLYVGQSKEIQKRLKEHLFINKAQATYSLRLPKIFKNGSVTITIYEFDKFFIEKDPRVLQIFEDLLWQDCKPLFGRQGAK